MFGMACFARTPNVEECQKEIETALKNIENGKKPLAAADYVSAGSCFKNLKKYDTSLECFINASKLELETQDYAGACATHESVADAYGRLNNSEKAKEYYTLAIDYCLKAGLTGRLVAEPYRKLGDYSNSCKYCQIEKDYAYCKEYNFCKEDSSNTLIASSTGGSSSIYLILAAAILLILAAGLFLSKKKK